MKINKINSNTFRGNFLRKAVNALKHCSSNYSSFESMVAYRMKHPKKIPFPVLERDMFGGCCIGDPQGYASYALKSWEKHI